MKARNLLGAFTVAASMFIGTPALAKDYQEGVHYTTIGEPEISDTVTEYYSVLCPACYRFSPLMKQLEEQLAERGIDVEYKHVDFLGHGSKSVQQELSILTAAAFSISDEEGKMFQAWLYNEIHQNRWHPEDVPGIWMKMTQQGVSPAVMDKANDTAFRESMASYFDNLQNMVDRDALKGTPTLVVNEAYRIETGGLNKSDPFGDLIKLIEHLNAKEQ